MNLRRHNPKPNLKRAGLRESRIDRIERNLIADMQAGKDWEMAVKRELNALHNKTRRQELYY